MVPEEPVNPEKPPVVPEEPVIPEAPAACEECGKVDGHESTCSQFVGPVMPECTCGSEPHAEGCPLYKEPECTCGGEGCEVCGNYPPKGPAIDFDVDEAYDYLMSCETTEEMDAYAEENFTDEIIELFSDEQWEEILNYYEELYTAEQAALIPAENYDAVAPFVEEIPVVPVRRAARLMSTRSTSTYNLTTAAEGDESSAANNGLELSKTVTGNATDGYTLKLEAYTTGTVTEGQATPSDIILVLDMSTSMDESFSSTSYTYTETYSVNKGTTYYLKNGTSVSWCNSCNSWTSGCGIVWGYHVSEGTPHTPKTSAEDTDANHVQFYTRTTVAAMDRREAMIQAATAFIVSVADEATDDRIAVVGFEDNASYLSGGKTAATALQDATANEDALKAAVNISESSLKAATEHGKGLEYAVNIFAAAAAAGTDYNSRNKVVVMLTDGEPEPMSSGSWSSRIVKQAIDNAYALKNTYNASVYTISVMPGTNAANPTSNMDRYMDYISSNYPDAQYTGSSENTTNQSTIMSRITPGTKINTANGSYYLTASDISTLNSIFGQIADQTGSPSISLEASTVIRDVVSPYFELPDGADKSQIIVSTKDATYTNSSLGWTNETIIQNPDVEIVGNTINVKGFNFDENYVAETGRTEGDVSQAGNFHGRKLIITVPIVVRDGFLGGNNVPTNNNGDNKAAVYDSAGKKIEEFNVPTVNVPIPDVTVTVEDKNVYLSGNLTTDDMLAGATATAGGVNLLASATDLDWRDDYVEISGTLDNATKNGLTELQADTEYTYTVTVSPKDEKSSNEMAPVGKKFDDATGKINVFKPYITVTATDIWADYKQTVVLNTWGVDENNLGILWQHKDSKGNLETAAEAGLEAEDAPTVTPKEFTFTQIVNGTETACDTEYVTTDQDADFNIKSMTCTVGTVTYPVPAEALTVNKAVSTENHDFTIHINHFKLTITKNIKDMKTGEEIYYQDFIFDVVSETGETFQVVIHGNGSKTVKGLVCGKKYDVIENNKWSWRYSAVNGTGEWEDVTFNTNPAVSNSEPTMGNKDVAVENQLNDNKWLSGNSIINNRKPSRRKKREED